MKKLSIKIIMIGHIDRIINFNLIKKYKSKLFEIQELNRISDLPVPFKDDGYLDVEYTVDDIQKILNNINTNDNDICIAVMNYKFNDNFYMHRLGENSVCISTYAIDNILNQREISIENFLIKNIYECITFYKIFNQNLIDDEVFYFVHGDTRGCLFDLNGDKNEIIYNTEEPIICNECESKINKKSVESEFINVLKRELSYIKKPWIKSVELVIKKYPLASLSATIIFSIVINLISNILWETYFKN